MNWVISSNSTATQTTYLYKNGSASVADWDWAVCVQLNEKSGLIERIMVQPRGNVVRDLVQVNDASGTHFEKQLPFLESKDLIQMLDPTNADFCQSVWSYMVIFCARVWWTVPKDIQVFALTKLLEEHYRDITWELEKRERIEA